MNPLRVLPALVLTLAASFAFAADNAAPASSPAAAATAPKPSASERRATNLVKGLKLTDAATEAKTRAILESHFTAMEQWHAVNDPALTQLWSEWTTARNQPTKVEAAKVGEKIDAIYATFRPQHDAFLAALAKEISPANIESIKNSLTNSPGMDRTANAYIEMIPQFTDADKAFVRSRFALAREQSIDTTTGKEIVAFFKRQKDIVEAYIDEKGYDYQKSRAAWVAKTDAAAAAAKAAKAAGAKKE
ncbi:MAG TPA: DUF3826 domain-containing protein [Opitutaceae bacterium]|nr:DUF3826 domain-containing protein [Opitutaceae bacterium]